MSTGKTVRTATIRQRLKIPASPEAVYEALTNARLHAAFTGALATGRARSGYGFTAWDGYVEGRHLVLRRGRLIVQEWSTSEWPEACPPSRLEFRLKPAKTGTELIMVQSGVPAAQSRNLRSGWAEYYWKPLRAWFAKSR
jgi:activator of HSP90 ATPase